MLTQEEALRLLQAIDNPEHRALLTLIYASGLRVGEVVKLRKKDIDTERGVIHIRQGKGKKDRYTMLSTVAYRLLEPTLGTLHAGRLPVLGRVSRE